jgi:hypothetical protein
MGIPERVSQVNDMEYGNDMEKGDMEKRWKTL